MEKGNSIRFSLTGLLLLVAFIHTLVGDSRTYVGVLEDCAESQLSKQFVRKVRPLFLKGPNGWMSLENQIADKKSYPSETEWTIAFDGRCMESLVSRVENFPEKYEWYLPREVSQAVDNRVRLPRIGSPSEEYRGFTDLFCYRPLVLSSKDNCRDPQTWKSFKADNKVLELVRSDFLRHLRKRRYTCPDVDPQNPPLLVQKSYKSSNGEMLIDLDTECAICVWFYVDREMHVQNLSSMVDLKYLTDDFGDDDDSRMVLIDAGDYDKDGTSEVIFWVSRYDRDGYVMFFNHFSRFVEFSWAYH